MATQVEKAITKARSLLGSHSYDNLCQKFVRVCYEAAGIYGSASSARVACNKWKVSSSKTDIPTGATVYFFNSSDGHVGIYTGNGKMIHAWGSKGVIESDISICSNYQGWGWQGGQKPTGAGKNINISGSKSGSDGSSNSSSKTKVDICSTSIAYTVNYGTEKANIRQYVNITSGYTGYNLHIVHDGIDYQPLVADEVEWDTTWIDSASTLKFKVLKTEGLNFHNGDIVIFRDGNKGVFYGYLFEKSRSGSDGLITCTAYDQLRYLKNKETYVFVDRTYDDALTIMCNDFKLYLGTTVKTGYKLSKVFDDTEIFDILKEFREATLQNTGKLYLLRDNFGQLELRNLTELITDYLLTASVCEDFDYNTSVDNNTYNRIELYRDDDETGNRAKYIYQNTNAINRWGVLQLTQSMENGDIPNVFGKTLLDLYCRETRTLSIKGAFGDVRLRAGSSFFINLNLGDIVLNNITPIITSAKHKFGEHYTMDLNVIGGNITDE